MPPSRRSPEARGRRAHASSASPCRALLGLALALLVGACSAPAAPPEPPPSTVPDAQGEGPEVAGAEDPPADTEAGGSAAMARDLAEIAGRVRLDRGGYLDAQGTGALLEQPPPSEPAARMRYEFAASLASLRAGEPEAAVRRLETLRSALLDMGQNLEDDAALRDVTTLLATSWLRLGEQENCAANHNADSCLLPIAGGGVHEATRGSRNALTELDRLLRVEPDDLGARWLANLAAMTLAEHPDALRPEWVIDPAVYASEAEIARMLDVAPGAGLARQGLSGGSVMDDLDGDGDLDVMASSWGPADPLFLARNEGDGRFTDVSSQAGLDGLTGGLNLVHADYDDDGDRDVLVLRGAWMYDQGAQPNSLLRNEGDGTFVDVTREAGLYSRHPTQTAAWGDYDNDGDLDLYVGNESGGGGGTHPNELFRNEGDGTFTEVGARLDVDAVGFSKAVAWGDVDEDGDLDLFVSRLGQPNLLLRNEGAYSDGSWLPFTDATAEAGVQEPVFSFPAWFFDYDQDGRLDLFVAGYGNPERFLVDGLEDVVADVLGQPTTAERPRLYRGNGDGTFRDVTAEAGLDHVLLAMGANHGDLDNDGWPDLYVGTGDPDFRTLVPNRAFLGGADGRFRDATTAAGLGHLQKGHGISFGDIDNDGDQDVHTVLGGAYEGDWYMNALFENPGNDNAWITLRLEGDEANHDGIGARVQIDVAGPSGPRSLHHLVGSGGSFGASSLQVEAGLGDAEAIERVEIRWPGGDAPQVLPGVPPNRAYVARQGAEALEPLELGPIELPEPMQPGMDHEHGG